MGWWSSIQLVDKFVLTVFSLRGIEWGSSIHLLDIAKTLVSTNWRVYPMTDTADRRIQLRESIHQLVVKAASARCVTPAALVSMVMYDYLRECGELTVVTQVSTTPPLHPKPARQVDHAAIAAEWDYGDED